MLRVHHKMYNNWELCNYFVSRTFNKKKTLNIYFTRWKSLPNQTIVIRVQKTRLKSLPTTEKCQKSFRFIKRFSTTDFHPHVCGIYIKKYVFITLMFIVALQSSELLTRRRLFFIGPWREHSYYRFWSFKWTQKCATKNNKKKKTLDKKQRNT